MGARNFHFFFFPAPKHNPPTMKTEVKKKLVAHLKDHEKYICDYRLLKKAVALGVEVKKVHRVLEHDQAPWLSGYIEKNTEYRANARNDFENSIYGKTCEDIRNRRSINITDDRKKAEKMVDKNTFITGKEIDGLYFLEMGKECIVYNKPSYVGACILDVSKKLMLDFHYGFMKEQYGDKATMLYTDTDSLVYKVETDNIFNDISALECCDDFDLSNMDNHYHSDANKKVAGKMKSETGSKVISEWISLRPKCYSLYDSGIAKDKDYMRKCKGIQSHVVRKKMEHDDLRGVLQERKSHHKRLCQPGPHHLQLREGQEGAVTVYDKMWVCDDGIQCLPYGHYRATVCA